jgi:nucleoside-diphosphate-sugar epimerase
MNTNRIISDDINKILKEPLPWNELSNKNIIITGGGGMIASYCAFVLLELNCKVVLIVRNKKSTAERFAQYINSGLLTIIEHDVTIAFDKSLEIEKYCKTHNLDYIFSAASPVGLNSFQNEQLQVLDVNIDGTKNVYEFAKNHLNPKVLLFSSIAAHTSPIRIENVSSNYAIAKIASESYAYSYSRIYNIETKIARIGVTYGPLSKLNDITAWTDFVKSAIRKDDITILSDGKKTKEYCYLSDMILGIFYILFYGIPSKPYDIYNPGEIYSIKEIAEIIAKDNGIRVNVLNTDSYIQLPPPKDLEVKSLSTLGFEPKITFKVGIRRTIEYFKEVMSCET